jgi:transposase
MSRIEVLSGPERRRRWSAEQKQSIVAEAFAPGTSVCEVARRVDLVPSLIYRWRQELRSAAETAGKECDDRRCRQAKGVARKHL